MDAAVLHTYGAPVFDTFPAPEAGPDTLVATVTAAAISRFDIVYASGRHTLKPAVLPCVVGSEGIGRLADGRRVYFSGPVPPYGAMAQQTLVRAEGLIDVPAGVDDAVAAALCNSGLAAWLPLEWRAGLAPGETVLVLGATGIVGRLAVQAAKLLGAGRVVAAGRDAALLEQTIALGADATVLLTAGDLPSAYRAAAGGAVNVILDYVWGAPAEAALQAAAPGGRLVQIGTAAGEHITLPAALLRGQSLAVLGYANYHASLAVRTAAYRRMAELAAQGQLQVDVTRIPLRQIEQAWEQQRAGARQRLVVIP